MMVSSGKFLSTAIATVTVTVAVTATVAYSCTAAVTKMANL